MLELDPDDDDLATLLRRERLLEEHKNKKKKAKDAEILEDLKTLELNVDALLDSGSYSYEYITNYYTASKAVIITGFV